MKIKIFKVPILKKDKEKIIDYITKIENDNEYIFNLFSMITMPIFHGVKIYKALNCMSFVSKVIELSDSVKMKKEYYKYSIKEVDKLLENYLMKEEYLYKEKEDNKYMSKNGVIFNLKMFFKLNGQLIYRILFKRKDSYE